CVLSDAITGFARPLCVVPQQGVAKGSFTADIDIALFTMVVIGGLNSIPGGVLGAIAVWSAMYFLPAGWAALVNGGGILLLLVFLPEGLGGLMYKIRGLLLYQVAKRRGMASGTLAQQLAPEQTTDGDAPLRGEGPMPVPALSGGGPSPGTNGASVGSGAGRPNTAQASGLGPI